MLPLYISAARSGRRESNPRSRSGAPVCRRQHFAREERGPAESRGVEPPDPFAGHPFSGRAPGTDAGRTLQSVGPEGVEPSPARLRAGCARHYATDPEAPPPGVEPGPSALQADAQTSCARVGCGGVGVTPPVAATICLSENPSCPQVPSALTPSSLGCSRDEHRSAWFRTQDSNLEFAVQSRASCQLDQSGAVPPPSASRTPNHRIDVNRPG
jgi:hypothetical protein